MFGESALAGLINRLAQPRTPKSIDGLELGRAKNPQGRSYPIRMPLDRRSEHMVVLGKTGMGKTNFLENLARQHMSRGEGFAFFDYHGDAVRDLMEVAAQYPDAADR